MISSFPNPPKSSSSLSSSPPPSSGPPVRLYSDQHTAPRHDSREASKPRVLPPQHHHFGDPSRYDLRSPDSGSPNNDEEQNRYGHIDMTSPGIPSTLNIDDTIALHLAVETAIFDSSRFELLSSEQVEDLKREQSSLTSRLEALRQKLALENKIRDAAISLGRLHPSQPNDEIASSNARCERISADLRTLDFQLRNIQHRLLRHTAGILGLTHHNNKHRHSKHNSVVSSSQTYFNLSLEPGHRGSRQRPPEEFDDRSLYRPADGLDEFQAFQAGYGNSRNSDRTHTKVSSLRSSTHQDQEALAVTEKKLIELNSLLKDVLPVDLNLVQLESSGSRANSLQEQLKTLEHGLEHVKTIIAEQKSAIKETSSDHQTLQPIWDALQAHDLDVRGSSTKKSEASYYERTTDRDLDESDSEDDLSHVDGAPHSTKYDVHSLVERIGSVTTQSLRLKSEKSYLEEELAKLKAQNQVEIQKTEDAKTFHEQQILGLTNSLSNTMNELSQVSSKQEGDTLQMRQEISTLQAKLDDQEVFYNQQLESIQQAANGRAAEIEGDFRAAEEEIKKLKSVVDKKERDLNSLQSDIRNTEEQLLSTESRKDSDRQQMESLNAKLQESEDQISILEERLTDAAASHSSISQRLQEQSKTLEAAENTKRELENKIKDMDSKYLKNEQTINAMRDQFEEAQRQLEDNKKSDSGLQLKIADLEDEVLRLKEELEDVTISLATTKASSQQELDVVKKQAAATMQAEMGKTQAAMDPGLLIELEQLSQKNEDLSSMNTRLQSELDEVRKNLISDFQNGEGDLQDRCDSLQKELNEMLFDYEALMKASVDSEAERSRLESQIDNLQDKIETLESHLADEKIKWLGNGSSNKNNVSQSNGAITPGVASSGDSVTISVLRAEFKKMMRDMRTDHNRSLRVEQESKRKLENELRQLRKDYHQLQKQNL